MKIQSSWTNTVFKAWKKRCLNIFKKKKKLQLKIKSFVHRSYRRWQWHKKMENTAVWEQHPLHHDSHEVSATQFSRMELLGHNPARCCACKILLKCHSWNSGFNNFFLNFPICMIWLIGFNSFCEVLRSLLGAKQFEMQSFILHPKRFFQFPCRV